MTRQDAQMRIRVPEDVKDWLKRESAQNLRTQSAEIVFALREKMAAGEGRQTQAPAADVD